ncbi:MAG: hypothetical protein CME06_10490 [Gemmatimonadetes bacterium]|nr:hypothetical protein [Gemmatimonadota bacterium]
MRNEGFTLLEIMVAAAILAYAVASVLGVFGEGIRSGRWSTERTHAMLQARSIMDDLLRQSTFEELEESEETEDGRYLWTIRIGLEEDDEDTEDAKTPKSAEDPFGGRMEPEIERYRIDVLVEWPPDEPRARARLITTQTQKVTSWPGL